MTNATARFSRKSARDLVASVGAPWRPTWAWRPLCRRGIRSAVIRRPRAAGGLDAGTPPPSAAILRETEGPPTFPPGGVGALANARTFGGRTYDGSTLHGPGPPCRWLASLPRSTGAAGVKCCTATPNDAGRRRSHREVLHPDCGNQLPQRSPTRSPAGAKTDRFSLAFPKAL